MWFFIVFSSHYLVCSVCKFLIIKSLFLLLKTLYIGGVF